MNRVFYWLADVLAPFYHSPLTFPENESEGFVRGEVFRAARLSQGMQTEFGVFALIGLKYARRVARAWRPHEIHLLEDVSLAFNEVEDRANTRIHVPEVHVQRLTDAIVRYFDHLREPFDRDDLYDAIQEYIKEMNEAAEDDA